MNIDFPASVLIYPGGAGIIEVFYRLLLDPLLLGLVSHVLLKGRGQRPIFWALAFLTSLIEPLTQGRGLLAFGLPLMLTVLGLDFGHDLAQAMFFSKYGFLAAIVMRIAFFLCGLARRVCPLAGSVLIAARLHLAANLSMNVVARSFDVWVILLALVTAVHAVWLWRQGRIGPMRTRVQRGTPLTP